MGVQGRDFRCGRQRHQHGPFIPPTYLLHLHPVFRVEPSRKTRSYHRVYDSVRCDVSCHHEGA